MQGAAAASSGASSHAVASSETSAEDELEVFYQEKRQQLELWKSIIVQRREQNELEERALHTYFNSAQAAFADSMTVESATRIQDLYNKLSAENQRLLQSLFIDGHQAASAAAVPHNIRFAEIILLIEGCGGSIIRKHGSHFAIKLPNTYCISSADACMQRNTLTYLDLPIVTMGGSFQPHGGGDEWCLAAHKLCRKAFEKAGITMERIKAAKNLFAGRPRAACQP